MSLLSFIVFAFLVLGVYFLSGVIVRFIRRCFFIRKMKKKVNDLLGGGSDDGAEIS